MTALCKYSRHGDPEIFDCFQRLLEAVCRPLAVYLMRWIFDGFLDDPYDEFFIICDAAARDEEIWSQKYGLDLARVPGCFKVDLAEKVLKHFFYLEKLEDFPILYTNIFFLIDFLFFADFIGRKIDQLFATCLQRTETGARVGSEASGF